MLRKLLSFFVPITKRYDSDVSGRVEVTTMYGHTELNTRNANYSYGSLQRILKKGLKKMDLDRIASILILGVAGGSVIKTLRKDFKFGGEITGVELDPMMLEIADEVFNLKNDANTELIQGDALKFVRDNKQQFDLIIIDLFIDDQIPIGVMTANFWKHLTRRSKAGDQILFNTIEATASDVRPIIAQLNRKGWLAHEMKLVDGTNHLYLFTRS